MRIVCLHQPHQLVLSNEGEVYCMGCKQFLSQVQAQDAWRRLRGVKEPEPWVKRFWKWLSR